jgi:hypothetical protein
MRLLVLVGLLAAGCTGGEAGDGGSDASLPAHDLARPECANGLRDGDETDVDCGGSCAPCLAGQACAAPKDCSSQVCNAGRCNAPSCADGIANGTESDTDCGGACPPCGIGQRCRRGADCQTGACASNRCVAGICGDGILNGSESDVDCGGSSCPPCSVGQHCRTAADCASIYCDPNAAICAIPDLLFVAPDFAGIDAQPPYGEDLGGVDLGLTSQFAEAGAVGGIYPSLIVGDFDGDGRADVAVIAADWTSIATLLGNGDGTFQSPILSVMPWGYLTGAADFDEDGRLDLLSMNFGLRGSGDGRFAPAAGFNRGSFAGDFDGDGHIDVADGDQVLWGDGRFGFQAGQFDQLLLPTTAVADFDGDGLVEALSDHSRQDVDSLVEVDSFTPQRVEKSWDPIPFQGGCGDCRYYEFAGDFDGNGSADLVVFHSVRQMMNYTYTVEVWTKTPAITTDTELDPFFAADFDGDGNLDVLASGRVWLGHGDGTFTKGPLDDVAALAGQNSFPGELGSGDFDGDGKADLAIAVGTGNKGAGPYELRIFLSRF